jgi:hypothetical protein
MADETVNVKIKFNANTRELKSAVAEMSALKKMENRFSSGRKVEQYAGTTASALKNVTSGWKRHFDQVDAGAKMMGKMLGGFLKLAIKGVVVEMALLGATMVGVHALFVAGQYIMKAYKGAMGLAAQGAAFATVALAGFSAAIREQQAAMYAYRGKGAPAFGSAMNQTRMAMRNMQSDAELASLGIEALNKAYGTMSKTMNTVQLNQSTGAIKALMDFGSAGQDPAKGLEQVAVVISTLKDKKKGISDVLTEAKKLGPEMEKAVKDANVKTKKQFEELLMSGDLAKKGGVTGQFAAVNSTLMSQLKGYMTQLRGAFADVGDYFLEPLKKSFAEVFDVIKRDMQRILGTVQYTMGSEGYFDGVASVVEKVSNWMVKTIREYLPAAQGAFGRMGDWFTNFKRGWNEVLDQTRPLIDGAKVIYKAWDPIWGAIKRGASNLTLFRALLIDNQDDMAEFGERIAGFIDKLSEFFGGMKRMFADMAPFINDMISGLTGVFGLISKVMTPFAGGGLATALAPLMAFNVASKKLSSVKGGFLPGMTGEGFNTKNMTVNAGNVVIGGAGPTGPGGSGGGGGEAGRLSSGAAAATDAGLKFKTTGGSISKTADAKTYANNLQNRTQSMEDLQNTGRNSFLYSVRRGSQIQVQDSNLEERRARRFDEKLATGRGLAYALANQGTKGGPYADNPDVHAMRVLQGKSRADLANQATFTGMGDQITQNMSRAQLIQLVQSSPMYKAEDYKDESVRPSIGEGARNTAKNLRRGARAGVDRAQYGARRLVGAGRGAMAYLNSGAWDPEKGQYNNLKEMRDQIDAKYQQEIDPQTGRDTRMGRLGARLSRASALNRVSRNYSKAGNAYNNRFAKSTGGRMGAGMALGVASQYAPEEMRGAMALGGMAAQIDPRLGIAVAGIGGALTARGAGKGALSGAAGGAAIGGMLGPYGAAIGAGVGALVGAISGAVNAGKYKLKLAQEAAKASLASLYSGVLSSAQSQLQKNAEKAQKGEKLTGPAAFMAVSRKMYSSLNAQRNELQAIIKRTGGKTEDNELGDGETKVSDIYDTDEYKDPKAILNAYFKTTAGSKLTKEQREDMLDKPVGAIRKLEQGTDLNVTRNLERFEQINQKRLEQLSKDTGKSAAELELIAAETGIDLYDVTKDYGDILNEFTGNLIKNKDQLNAALTDVFLAGANPFKKEREAGEAAVALNSIGAKISDIGRGKGTKKEKTKSINAQMEQLIPSLLAAAGGDSMKAFEAYTRLFGDGVTPGTAFGEGQQFEGMEQYFDADNEAFQQSMEMITGGVSGELGTQIRSRLSGESGRNIDSELFAAAMGNLTPAQLSRVNADLARMDEDSIVNAGETYTVKAGEKYTNNAGRLVTATEDTTVTATQKTETNQMKRILYGTDGERQLSPEQQLKAFKAHYNLTGFQIEQTDTAALNAIASMTEEQKKATVGLTEAITLFNTNANNFMSTQLGGTDGPSWWNKGLAVQKDGDGNLTLKPPADTSTPRAGGIGDTATSKLSQTMGRHAAMDGQLTGKRTVTSSLRYNALGSINSDHATGSAYDLTGQNLGMYARMVHANGGFAEFHGTLGDRHLHVVPGPGLMGDTTSPRSAGPALATAAPSGGVTNYYSFEISGGDSEAIANKVMEKIRQAERNSRERA